MRDFTEHFGETLVACTAVGAVCGMLTWLFHSNAGLPMLMYIMMSISG